MGSLHHTAKRNSIPEGWRNLKLGSVFSLSSGNSKPENTISILTDENVIPVYGGNGVLGYTDKCQDVGEQLVIGRVGINCGNIYYINGPYWITDNALYAREWKTEVIIKYICYHLSYLDLGKLKSKTGQPLVSQKPIYDLPISLPPICEQKKVSQILSTWDRAIERVQRLIEAKQRQKAKLVSQLLSGRMRFPGFQDEWKQVRLGTFLHPKFRKVVKPAGAYLRLGIRSHGKGTFTSVVDDPETIALTHLFQTHIDDLIVNITFAWEGAIALVGPDGDGALVSHRFPTYVFDISKMLPEYFKHLMVTDRFFYELDLISPGGAGRNRVMNKGDFLKITVAVPDIEEQKKIAGVLGGMDEQISLLKKYLEKLKEQKKGLMQKLLTGEIRVKVD